MFWNEYSRVDHKFIEQNRLNCKLNPFKSNKIDHLHETPTKE